ncbi:hypothetical protein ASF25_01635 [Methylobacterium sp. Leaf100]|nr:hypothetical protein ASF25_01635 [Methylobacterium sp. Leaf100]
MQHDSFVPASAPKALRPSDFSPEQRAGWVAASDRKAAAEVALAPDAGHTNDGDEREWFVAYTNPKREQTAAKTLQRREFVTCLPVMTVSRTRSRQRVTEAAPLLPRYLFVGLGPGQSLYGLRETPGLEGMVRVGGVPATVPVELIQGLRTAQAAGVYDFSDAAMEARAADEGAQAWARTALRFAPGRKVRVLSGAYRSFGGVVDAVSPPDRIDVWITLFGRSFSVPMMLADVALE